MYTATSYPLLYAQIVSYRTQNQLEHIDELKVVVENYLCNLPENRHKCENRKLERSWDTYVRGGVELLRNMFFKKQVTDEEAEARAKICVGCTYNYFPDKGPFVQWSDNTAIKQVGERRTSVHDKLGNCAVCSCPLRSKVFIGGKIEKLPEDQVKKMKKVGCWQPKLSGQG